MKALVIGGSGPTGPLIVQGLVDRGYEPVILNRGNHPVPELAPYEQIVADPHFEEPIVEAMEGRSFDLIIATYGRLRILVEVLRGVSERLITIGGTVYAKTPYSRPADEGSPRSPDHKLVQRIEETERDLLEAHRAGHFNLTHLRYPNLYGPRQLAPREWSIIRRLQDGRRGIPVMDGGLTLESRAFIENAAHAVLLAVDHPKVSAGRFYNVADEQTPSDGERALAIAATMGIEAELVNYPKEAGRPAHFWGVGRNLEYMGQDGPPPTHHKLLDITRIKEELGYRDLVPFEAAIERTVAWYLANPLERGGSEEARIGDEFDYAGEDRFEEALADFTRTTHAIEFADVSMRHSYDHPKKPQGAKP
jgi:nucleoside-diphosphate-sugar epimerase